MPEFTVSVGRCGQTNDVVVADASVSRQHLLLAIDSVDSIRLQDRQSAYGSFYWDGQQWQPFQQITLSANDYIVIGKTKLRLMELIIAFQIKTRNGQL
jgi:pSer/pThr/pTyr-binding forkhead associated (FHA) protein